MEFVNFSQGRQRIFGIKATLFGYLFGSSVSIIRGISHQMGLVDGGMLHMGVSLHVEEVNNYRAVALVLGPVSVAILIPLNLAKAAAKEAAQFEAFLNEMGLELGQMPALPAPVQDDRTSN